MHDAPINREDIFIAANALADQGIMPSILLVREQLGNRGSESTINKHLKEWKLLLLKKNSSGCVFCAHTQEQNEALSYKLERAHDTVAQLKDLLGIMLQNPDRELAAKEIVTHLQQHA